MHDQMLIATTLLAATAKQQQALPYRTVDHRADPHPHRHHRHTDLRDPRPTKAALQPANPVSRPSGSMPQRSTVRGAQSCLGTSPRPS